MAYDTALNIISDAAAELGLGTVIDAYGSTDANIIQLRTLLKSAGRDIVRDRDWTHLIKEYSFVTRPNWVASTTYPSNSSGVVGFTGNTAYTVGQYVSNGVNMYRVTTAGTSANGSPGPYSTDSSITDGTAVFKFINAQETPQGSGTTYTVYLCVVTKGTRLFGCLTAGTSGTSGPIGTVIGSTSRDGTVIWEQIGTAADYALPSDFSNLIDQTGWNRTNRLPVGGPIGGQVWQYLKGRAQGVVFNVLFRPVAGVMRLYPDTDTPGGYAITFEYVSSWWVGATGGSTPTADAPTANTDIIYFDALMMVRRLKLEWLQAKGFDTTHAQNAYDEAAEQTMNADGSAEVLDIGGRGSFDPLIGVQNVPPTGFGS